VSGDRGTYVVVVEVTDGYDTVASSFMLRINFQNVFT
jgi:hypothetical protein